MFRIWISVEAMQIPYDQSVLFYNLKYPTLLKFHKEVKRE